MRVTFGRAMLEHWLLDPDVTYLNHGTVGAVPRRVLDAQQVIRNQMERQPSRFMLRDLSGLAGAPTPGPTRLREAAADVAAFLGARRDDVVFVDNASAAMMSVLRSHPIAAGDDILLTDHNYGATAKAAAFVARERGAHVRTVTVPYPRFDPAELVRAVAAAIGPHTRIAVLDHITSATALIFPIAELAAICHERGVAVLADGAHVPGTLALDIPSLGVDWYAANLHKWAHAPRSCGILWAHPDRQRDLHPPVISWGLDNGFVAEFDWVGTRDPSPWLAAPAGLAFLGELDFAAVRRHNHDLAWRAAVELTALWGTTLERDEASVGSMVTIALPASLGAVVEDAARLRDALLHDEKIEVPVVAAHGRLWTRISAQVYNEWSDMERLGEAVEKRS